MKGTSVARRILDVPEGEIAPSGHLDCCPVRCPIHSTFPNCQPAVFCRRALSNFFNHLRIMICAQFLPYLFDRFKCHQPGIAVPSQRQLQAVDDDILGGNYKR